MRQDIGPPNAAPGRQTRAQRNVELLDDSVSLPSAIAQCKTANERASALKKETRVLSHECHVSRSHLPPPLQRAASPASLRLTSTGLRPGRPATCVASGRRSLASCRNTGTVGLAASR
jgi:hypothetical protein